MQLDPHSHLQHGRAAIRLINAAKLPLIELDRFHDGYCELGKYVTTDAAILRGIDMACYLEG